MWQRTKLNVVNYFLLIKLFLLPLKNSLFSVMVNNLVLPILFLVFFKFIYGVGVGDRITFILTGSLIIGVIGVSLTTLSNKINNIIISSGLEYFLSLSLNKYVFVLALLTSELLTICPSVLVTLLVGGLLFSVKIKIHWLMFVYLIQLSIAMIGLGIFIGVKAKNYNEVTSFSSLVSYLFIFLSPIYYPVGNLPGVIKYFSYIFPTTYSAEGIRLVILGDIAGNEHAIIANLLIMCIFIVLSIVIIEKSFKWSLDIK